MLIYNSELRRHGFNYNTATLAWREEHPYWGAAIPHHITINPWFDPAGDVASLFNFRYNGQYFSELRYFFEEDRLVLVSATQNEFDSWANYDTWLDVFDELIRNCVPDSEVEITFADLPNLYLRGRRHWNDNWDTLPPPYYRPFA
jgi:hypothetical protein